MPLVLTQAIILHTYPYGESSKIVRLATPDHGVVSALAKGAHRPRSKFGARLQPLSEGTASIYVKQSRELQTLSEFDVSHQRAELATDVARYAGAAALAELVLRCSPEDPARHLFEILHSGLDWLTEAPASEVEVVALAGIWGTVAGLGFAPALEVCAVDGRPLEEGEGRFSIPDGGLVCAQCGASRKTAVLPGSDRTALADFVRGQIPTTPIDKRHLAAHRRLVSRFVLRHVAEDGDMKALDFWETQGA